MMEQQKIKKAIKHFENMANDATIMLTIEEDTLNPGSSNDLMYKNRKMYAELAVGALEKQIAKKPVCKEDTDTSLILHYYCPACGKYFGQAGKHNVIIFNKESYCQGTDCGQKIDWESVENGQEGK